MANLLGYSVLVDNEEQAEQLQKMAFEQDFEWEYSGKKIRNLDGKSFQFGNGGKKLITFNYVGNHYQDKHITKKAHFNELFNSLEQCNMKLTKEQVYINLKGKTREELTELYWLLKNNNQDLFHNDLSTFIEEYYKTSRFLEFYCGKWGGGGNLKTEVTIEQLKEILQPIDTLEQQLQKAEAEVKRLQYLIEEENKPKVGDWVIDNGIIRKVGFNKIIQGERKITNPKLIELLENEVK